MAVADWRWISAPPRSAFRTPALSSYEPKTVYVLFVSTLVSFALAATVRATALSAESYSAVFFGAFFRLAGAIGLYGYFLYRLLQGVAPGRTPVHLWVRRVMISSLPLHLLLPVALISTVFHPLSGEFIYLCAQCLLLAVVIRRWVWAFEASGRFPIWLSSLLVTSPFLVLGAAIAGTIVLCGAVFAFSILAGIIS